MAVGNRDFLDVLEPYAGPEGMRREELVKIVYLRDKRALPDEIKRLFDQATVLPLKMEETRDIAEAMRFASGEAAGVSLGAASGTIHYVRRSLHALKDRELSVDWAPREDPLEGDVLPLFDGLLLDMAGFDGVEVDAQHETLRAEVGVPWKAAFQAAEQAHRLLPLLPVLPASAYVGDVLGGTAVFTSFFGGPGHYLRNVDFLAADTNYSQSGFDLVPNNATGYDLNSLLLLMGGSLGVPISLTFRLLPIALTKTLRFTLASWEALTAALQALRKARLRPLRVVFGDPTYGTSFAGSDGYSLEINLGGTPETLASQEKALEGALGEDLPKEAWEGLGHLTREAPGGKTPFHIAEIRTALADVPSLWEDLATWSGRQGPAFGLAGYLQETGTVGLLPFARADLRGTSTTGGPVDIVLHRGDRFDRVAELVKIAQRHPCRLRNNQLTQLLAADKHLRRRFALVRRIKEEVDLGNIVNPSGLLWVPQPR